jgi:hypothetical protein
VVSHRDRRPLCRKFQKLGDVPRPAVMVKSSRQIEVAVVDKSVPVYGNEGPAHDPFEGAGIEGFLQFIQIGVEVA